MKIRAENAASMTERLKGGNEMHPVSFTGWKELMFSVGSEFHLLAPAVNRPPMPAEPVTTPMLASEVAS